MNPKKIKEPTGEPSMEETPEDCNDGIDNDDDSLIDCAIRIALHQQIA